MTPLNKFTRIFFTSLCSLFFVIQVLLYQIPDITENNLLSPSIDEEFREEVRREKEHEKKKIEDMKNLSGYGKSITSSRTKTFENRLNSTDVRSEMAKKTVGDKNSVPDELLSESTTLYQILYHFL